MRTELKRLNLVAWSRGRLLLAKLAAFVLPMDGQHTERMGDRRTSSDTGRTL
jgi:hypothetical protein